MATTATPKAASSTKDDQTDVVVVPIVAVPMAGGGVEATSGSVAVPAGLRGRTRASASPLAAGVIRPVQEQESSAEDEDEVMDADVFRVSETGIGVASNRPVQA
jgi:hypothetical protein